ncbi:uncharacterized protein LOC119546774 [Drosophila subpulchrella]|uniref:uncharacterized protein LOC119546774 n=1 Tax=Drosophila subpulchrella TaxID=1486046 RepID=UPI0018A14A3C|nr:uncharacterized protein LOC119546774 [Drosophila subpulchrella]
MDQRTCQCKKRNVNPLKKKFSQLLKKNSHSETEKLRNEMYLVKNELEKAYEVIDDLEFELESVDLLALQNQWLRDELMKLKAQEDGVISRDEEEDPASRKRRRSYRQQVSVGMLDPQLISPPQEQRFGIILD